MKSASSRALPASSLCCLALVLLWPALCAAAHPPAVSDCIEVPPQDASESFRFQPSLPHVELMARVPEGARIGSIRQQRFTVFDTEDPREDHALFRLANDVHSVTRSWVIDDHLLIEEGEEYQRARIMESARILRELAFIYDATVRPWRLCGDVVDIEVITRDIWTLTPMLEASRRGGENRWAVGFRDANFLGTGKQIVLMHESDEERSGTTIRYFDPALRGSRWRMRLSYTDTDDGYEQGFGLERPFFSVFERWSAGVNLNRSRLEESLWFRGDEVAEFEQEVESVSVYGGIASARSTETQVGRWLLGYTFEAHDFAFSDSPIPPAELPADRTYSYPYLAWETTADRFLQLRNFNFLGRTEDVYVGRRYGWTLGWSAEALGSSRDQLVFRGNYAFTLRADERSLWQADSRVDGYLGSSDGDFENLHWRAETRYIHKQAQQWASFARLRLEYVNGLTADRQLSLGGHNGLRGYDLHYQVGDRAFLLNLEQRYYSNWHPFRLLRVGLAAFVDVGRAWFEDQDNGSNGGVLANAGIGLRLNSSRAEKSSVAHIDLAFPFMKDDGVSTVQLQFTLRDRF